MKRWRGFRPVTAAAAATAMLLTGCGGGADEAVDTSKLTVWMMGAGSEAQTAFLDGVEATFKEKHPDTDVVVQYVPWLEAPKKFQTALAGGDGPDVTELGNTETQGWAAQEALADVSDRMDGWAEGKDILPDLLSNAQLDGKQYGVPWYAGVRAVYYRTDWFAKAGLQPPKTWDELVTVAKTVQQQNPGKYGFALPGNSELPFYSFLWSTGAEIATKDGDSWKSGYDTPEAKQAVKFWTDLVTTHKVAPPAAAGWNELDAQKQFATGQAAMAVAGSWPQTAMLKDNPDLAKVWGTFPIPGPDGKPAPAFAGGSDIGIWQDSKKQDLAWDYVTILLNKQNSQEWAKSLKFFPVYKDLTSPDEYANDPVMGTFATVLQDTKLTPITPKWVEVSRSKTVTQTMNSSIMKGTPLDQAVSQAATEMEQILNAK
ncbi:sugar ABC transporter substrate-binding protein [Plantactinospora sp. GCM10030261]|uniref:sugar ABC transporter substrate-binding protein n=1 Tax=Plantactinospora sp. GCM10030261 TaxID=3273420 RepID=UPI0036120205